MNDLPEDEILYKDKKLFIEENRFYFEEFDKMKAKFFPNEDIE